ncbi:sensor histidine kinase [Celerinatantimonas diazotrophica]|uniref:histidine kinase n=1 Tax=Celerinatantimonas diazotrophica TaxID=412034 RepID=A0A4R1J9H8_9GAMM|nr:ATP-binding protein [Celerinatantimonas diazotrophica]TCK47252.1 phospho-acceptor domain-containing protein [Celerinatantimonas diazotrophica]CAG9296024.1 Adaptive-response sensory-kinase SasA [Celerinatantimonas diazotrophica]
MDTKQSLFNYQLWFLKVVTIWLIFLIAFGTVEYLLYRSEIKAVRIKTIAEQNQVVKFGHDILERHFASSLNDIRYLAKLSSIQAFLTNPTRPENKAQVTADLYQFISTKYRSYLQARILNEKGQELIRIDKSTNDKHAQIIRSGQLQNKAHRTYFMNSASLKTGDIYISRFDLNVEHHKIIRPFQPTYRFVINLGRDAQGHKVFLILNCDGSDILRQLNQLSTNIKVPLWVVNSASYFIKGPSPQDEWGWQIAGRANQKLETLYPQVWAQLCDLNSRNTHSLEMLTFSEVNIKKQLIKQCTHNLKSDFNHFYVISFLSAKEFGANNQQIFSHFVAQWLIGEILITFMVIGFGWLDYKRCKKIDQQYAAIVNLQRKQQKTMIALEKSNASLEQFAYIASHDLQEPLRVIASYVDLFTQHYEQHVDDKVKKYLFYITDATTRMRHLIFDLLDYSRVQAKPRAFHEVSLEKVFEQIHSDLSARIAKQNAQIDYTTPLPIVWGDQRQLYQLFLNLLTNALKFTQPDEIARITISAIETEQHWQIRVTDNGIGIEEQYQQEIFDIFRKLNQSDQYQGTGIGLAICKTIVENHNGQIELASELGKGTTFLITLPKFATQELDDIDDEFHS